METVKKREVIIYKTVLTEGNKTELAQTIGEIITDRDYEGYVSRIQARLSAERSEAL